MSTKGTRLDRSGWEPDENARSFAIMLGLDPDLVWAEFQDYWTALPGQRAVKVNWFSTWKNWCRKAEGTSRLAYKGPRPDGSSGGSKTVSEVLIGGHVVRYPRILHIEGEIRRGRELYPDEWRDLKAWQEAGGRSSVELPPEPKPLPTAEERAAEIEKHKKAGLL